MTGPATKKGKRELWQRVAWVLAGLVLGGLSAALTGIVPIRASSGHLPITEWFLETTMRRSVAVRSAQVPAVSIDDPGLILKGAGHYEIGCKPCHGAPGEPQSEYARNMTPSPPLLAETVGEWERDDLFYVVRHGVKFTGMPAWPSAHRDDEVWAMVAFLRVLPEMTAAEYAALAATGPAAPQRVEVGGSGEVGDVLVTCARCHGTDGNGRGGGVFPRLGGQSRDYLELSLVAYARGERQSGIMKTVAAALDRQTVAALARHYEGLGRGAPSHPELDPAAVERGAVIAVRGVPERKIPSCAHCHGPLPGIVPRNPAYPRIAGLHPAYLALQLHLFRAGDRGGSPYFHLMEKAVEGLREDEVADLAAYYGALDPESVLPRVSSGR